MPVIFDIAVYGYTFASVAAVSLLSLSGILLLSLWESGFRRSLTIFISVAVGALLGDAFIHLIPEALAGSESGNTASLLIVLGIVAFFILEKFLHWHHHGEDIESGEVHPVGRLILVSDIFHNFLDGVVIAASFTVSLPVGFATTIAVMLHEIPQEVGDFAVLLHAGYTKWRALSLNFLSALSSLLGALFFFVVGGMAESLTTALIPLAAGGFIYIAVADLIPELQKTKRPLAFLAQLIAIGMGVGAMFVLTWLE